MARHNREGRGVDQRHYDYEISYQPDWLRLVKVTRLLESGRQSTKTLFRNPTLPEQAPGHRVRTGIRSPEQGLELEVVVQDPGRTVRRVVVEAVPADASRAESVVFALEAQKHGGKGYGWG